MHHQNIIDFLWVCLQACGTCCRLASSLPAHRCDAPSSELEELQRLDIAGLSIFVAQKLQQDERHIMSRTGDEAQVLIDLLQGVRGIVWSTLYHP